MPSYPDSVKSFTAKTSGQNIDPAHVNDIQDEVNAIEAGLRNGTAPLNSSNSTVARLSVTNGSTLNTVQVSGGSTFAVRPVTPPPDAVRAYIGSTVTLGNGSSLSTLAFNTETYSMNSSLHATGTNNDRFVPQSTGIHELRLQVALNGAASTGFLQLTILDSSGSLAGCLAPITSSITVLQVATTKRFDVLGGYLFTRAMNSTLSTCSLATGDSFDGTWAEFRKL